MCAYVPLVVLSQDLLVKVLRIQNTRKSPLLYIVKSSYILWAVLGIKHVKIKRT